MEEKERYEIHIYDDICVDLYNNGVLDKSINDTYKLEKLLNQQDKRIKELENKLDILRQKDIIFRQNCRQGYVKDLEEMNNLREENQQLKKSQKQIAISELRRIKEYILINDKYDEEAGCNIIETFDLLEEIRDRIEKLGGGENEWYFKWKLFKTK